MAIKIVINTDFGGFGLSSDAISWLADKGLFVDRGGSISGSFNPLDRDHPLLIECVESLGAEKAGYRGAALRVVTIPDDAKDWYIDDYDGIETIREGRSWPGYEDA